MTWDEFMAARLLLAEEQVGVHERIQQRAEQAQVDDTKALIRRVEGNGVR